MQCTAKSQTPHNDVLVLFDFITNVPLEIDILENLDDFASTLPSGVTFKSMCSFAGIIR